MDHDDLDAFLDDPTQQLPLSSPLEPAAALPIQEDADLGPVSNDITSATPSPRVSPSPGLNDNDSVLPPENPSTTPLQSATLRRDAELQYLDAQAAAKRLTPEAKGELKRFILAGDSERQVMAYATALAIAQSLGALTAPEGPWKIPDELKTNINKYAIRLLLCSEIGIYDGDVPVNKVMALVETKLLSGTHLANARHTDDGKWAILEDCARHCLTQRKGDIKKRIEKSFNRSEFSQLEAPYKKGTHLVKLTQSIVQIGTKSVKHTGVVATAALCARIAILRDVLKSNPDNENYWAVVDETLRKIRTKGKDAAGISKVVQKYVDKDCKYWPGGDMSTLSKDPALTRDHVQLNNFAKSLATTLPPSTGSG
ncbi:uncharacterized protein B0H18DRAFT_1119495 [Fomitopsis serialis]|uniref:uncharacterized protein n=1 Tax=Fomitopsis serialis TaxID=139415 RepID=UPI002008690B|nr:uncharacterized protein B0H18DRAFT_1119495 [Neoantrodia serialis]KAH9925297.1 hypothetical protein B0H18DRAFT_1119495 [Neoantrodia serialis]